MLATGADPLNSWSLVHAAIGDLELELIWLPAGDPALKGARALFDDQSATISCERSDDPGECVCRIAHEIGHASCHAGSSACAASDIDATRSTEAAPLGLQRVEDYGVRERRELQANVFAREFLLPRHVARRLHVDDGLVATAIAERTRLPKNLVRQQLLDGILLPSGGADDAGEAAPGRAPTRDPSQERAAMHRGTPFQLQAGPGTGKTRTLVKRVLGLIDEGVDPSTILVLTFSNRAAGELSERIAAAAPGAAERVWAGTFHAFGLDLVRRYHDRLDLPANPVLFDKSDAIEVLEELLPTLPLVHYRNLWDPATVLRDVVVAISRAKDEVCDPQQYRLLAQAMLDGAVTADEIEAAEKCLEVASIYALYEQALRDNGAIDFGDLIMRPALLVESEPAIREVLRLSGTGTCCSSTNTRMLIGQAPRSFQGRRWRRWRAGFGWWRDARRVDLPLSWRVVGQHDGISSRIRGGSRRSALAQLSLDDADRECRGGDRAAHGRVRGHATARAGGRSWGRSQAMA